MRKPTKNNKKWAEGSNKFTILLNIEAVPLPERQHVHFPVSGNIHFDSYYQI